MKVNQSGLSILLSLSLSVMGMTYLSGCAGNQYDRSTGQYIDDKSLTVRVRSALHDSPDYKFDDVTVNVFRGAVQLSGFVNMADQKSKAESIAKGVDGVKDFVDNIS